MHLTQAELTFCYDHFNYQRVWSSNTLVIPPFENECTVCMLFTNRLKQFILIYAYVLVQYTHLHYRCVFFLIYTICSMNLLSKCICVSKTYPLLQMVILNYFCSIIIIIRFLVSCCGSSYFIRLIK